jgi:hypothetical protein
MRYGTLAELKRACDRARAAGEEAPVLTLDNDDAFAYAGDECMRNTHSSQVTEQALDLLGIPHEEPR